MNKKKIKKTTRIFEILLFITVVINVLFDVSKRETMLNHSDYKVLVQELEGSSNYVAYSSKTFPKKGYNFVSYDCKNGGTVKQLSKGIFSYVGNSDSCVLKFDLVVYPCNDNSLYCVIASESVDGGFAKKYTKDHEDAYDGSGTKDVYFFSTPIEYDETQGNQLLDKWNVIFGGFCWQMFRTTDTGGVKMIYNGVPSNGTCNNTGTAQQIGTSKFNESSNSLAYVGYMYNTVYTSQYKTAGAYMYGNSFTYSNGAYTLTDTITTTENATESDLKNHHYTCFNTTGTCSSISYIHYLSSSSAYYITLTNGKSVEDAINEMLYDSNVNTTNSTIKTYIDNWYQNNLLEFSSYLEDTVFCNDRSIYNKGGWNPNGGSVTADYNFEGTYGLNSLSCQNNTDRFSILNNSAKLTYPVGLASAKELDNINVVSRSTGEFYWTISPTSFSSYSRVKTYFKDDYIVGYSSSVGFPEGVRPVISLKPGTVYVDGDGSKNNPYIINTSKAQTTLNKLQKLNSNIHVNSETPDFSQTATTDEGLYAAEDDYGISYYFRGAVTNNYIQFGKNSSNQDLYWRIVRINGDGSLRLLYDGTAPGQAASISSSVYNNVSGKNIYLGYMHNGTGTSSNTNTNSSAVKQVVDSWYENNIKDKSFESNISDNLFCNDRSISSSNLPNLDYSGYYTYFSAYDRVYHNAPILTCPQINDAFTVSDTTYGNGSLTYPIGLLSADEYFMTNLNLGNSSNTWTMSPQAYCEEGMTLVTQHAWQYLVNNNQLSGVKNNISNNISPVINIKSSVIDSLTGTGTSTDPFVVH